MAITHGVSICEYFHNRGEMAHLRQEIQTLETRIGQIRDNYRQQVANDPELWALQAKAEEIENAEALAQAQFKEGSAAHDQRVETLAEQNDFKTIITVLREDEKRQSVFFENIKSMHQNKWLNVKEFEEYYDRKSKSLLWPDLRPLEDALEKHQGRLEVLEQNIEASNRYAKKIVSSVARVTVAVAVSAAAACYLGSRHS